MWIQGDEGPKLFAELNDDTRIEFPCIGYIGHPFVKEGPWAFIATLSLVARWYSAIDRGEEWFSYTRENRHLWTEAIKEGMQRLLERSAKDFFRHDATNWMDFVCQ